MRQAPQGNEKGGQTVGKEPTAQRSKLPERRLLELWKDSTTGDTFLIERKVHWNPDTHGFQPAEWIALAHCDPYRPQEAISQLGEVAIESVNRDTMYQPRYWDRFPWRCIVPERWLRRWYPLRVTPIISSKTPAYCCLCNRNPWECWNCRPK